MFSTRSFPNAILHVDGDAFFAGCEVAQNPALQGKPVVVGEEKGIATAVTYEAKALGVTRGMTVWQIRKLYPQVIVLPSHFEIYGTYSMRMNAIVRRYTSEVEEYSIDECFADITGLHTKFGCSYEGIARMIKNDLESDLGMTFSVGVGPTKVIAKVASKWKKPNGFTIIPAEKIHEFLRDIPVGAVWGIGPNTSAYLQKFGIKTALQFAERDKSWVMEVLSKPYQELWHELRGQAVYQVKNRTDDQKSVMKTRTFRPPSTDKYFVFSQISKNVERVCNKLRRENLFAREVSGFLKTQEFSYKGFQIRLPHALATPETILKHIKPHFERVWQNNASYRATGIIARSLCRESSVQQDLFGSVEKNKSVTTLYNSIDRLAHKYKDNHLVFLGSSMTALKSKNKLDNKNIHTAILNIPFWGEAS